MLLILRKTTKTRRLVKTLLVSSALSLLAGCQTTPENAISTREYQAFTPLTADKRIMNWVRIRWETRDDVAQYCARSIGMGREQAYITPPVACAVWQKEKNECLIVTGKLTTHVALGHEVRHCFEGHFHK